MNLSEEKLEQLERLRSLMLRHAPQEGDNATPIPGMLLYRRSEPTECTSAAYQPRLILYVQGQKRVVLGGEIHINHPGNLMLTAVDLPVVSQVTQASAKEPTLALLMELRLDLVREILAREEVAVSPATAGIRGLQQIAAGPELLGSFVRLIELLDRPEEIGFLHNLIERELHYRVLRTELGAPLKSVATLGALTNRTARAVAWLRTNYDKPLRVEELASIAQMGVSTLHFHFRALTAMSPLQYQKRLRLHVARVKMLIDGLDAASAAYEVGYESPSQFSREYRRLFGQPPARDVKMQRLMPATLVRE